MGRQEKLDNWVLEACELMARNGLSLTQAVAHMGLEITTEEIDRVLQRKSFNRLLWEARHRYFNELATRPDFKKETIIGRLVALAQKLEDEGAYDKAAEATLKAAKVAGFVGPESTVSVFGELSQADLDAIRRKLEGDLGKAIRPN